MDRGAWKVVWPLTIHSVNTPSRGAGKDPGGEGFDGVDDGLEARGAEQVERVQGAREFGVDDGVAGAGFEGSGDLDGDDGVQGAVGGPGLAAAAGLDDPDRFVADLWDALVDPGPGAAPGATTPSA
ncbi:hypothetical protein [Embleya sp. NPDC020630]|uniref:hypothetical protein n=1 Tax=Embleya sp. NPDC020630 TaxID=3363979 RepID=UPI00378F40BB